ncbi:MAG: hypothetical protein EBU75_09965 [Betaproteobacteria bacterium]|nr:hypothetical protein [Betaproteobacteria bacterium]
MQQDDIYFGFAATRHSLSRYQFFPPSLEYNWRQALFLYLTLYSVIINRPRDRLLPGYNTFRLQFPTWYSSCLQASLKFYHLQRRSIRPLSGIKWSLVGDSSPALKGTSFARRRLRLRGISLQYATILHHADTLKRADPQGRIQATVPREHLWAAQTPQMFRMGRLLDSLERALQAGAVVTDEASALEWAGYSPRLVIGPAENFKLTYPEDFRRAAWVLQQRVNSAGGSP